MEGSAVTLQVFEDTSPLARKKSYFLSDENLFRGDWRVFSSFRLKYVFHRKMNFKNSSKLSCPGVWDFSL